MNKLDIILDRLNVTVDNPKYSSLIKEEMDRAKQLQLLNEVIKIKWELKDISNVKKFLDQGFDDAFRVKRVTNKPKKLKELTITEFLTTILDAMTNNNWKEKNYFNSNYVLFIGPDYRKYTPKQVMDLLIFPKSDINTEELDTSKKITSINGADVYNYGDFPGGRIKGTKVDRKSYKGKEQDAKNLHAPEVRVETEPEIDATSQLTTNIPLPTLKLGSRGEEVKKLQTILFNDQTEWDGKFGTKTKAFLTAWQQVNILNLDGIYGPSSYERMKQTNGTWSLGKTETGANGSVKQNKTDLGNYIYTELKKKSKSKSDTNVGSIWSALREAQRGYITKILEETNAESYIKPGTTIIGVVDTTSNRFFRDDLKKMGREWVNAIQKKVLYFTKWNDSSSRIPEWGGGPGGQISLIYKYTNVTTLDVNSPGAYMKYDTTKSEEKPKDTKVVKYPKLDEDEFLIVKAWQSNTGKKSNWGVRQPALEYKVKDRYGNTPSLATLKKYFGGSRFGSSIGRFKWYGTGKTWEASKGSIKFYMKPYKDGTLYTPGHYMDWGNDPYWINSHAAGIMKKAKNIGNGKMKISPDVRSVSSKSSSSSSSSSKPRMDYINTGGLK